MIGELAQIRSWDDAASAVRKVWIADSLRGRFTRGAVWSLAGAAISQGSALAASIISARMLGPTQFGEFGIIQNTVGMFGVFAGLGLGLTATKFVAELRQREAERAGRIVALSTATALGAAIIASFVLMALAPWLAAGSLNAPHLSTELRIACGVLFLNAMNGAHTGALAGFEAFRAIARVNLVRGILGFPITVAGVWLYGLRGALAALIVTAAAGWILNHAALLAECKRHSIVVRWHRFWPERAILWRFSIPAFLGGAMSSPAMWAASAILANQPDGYKEMGIFTAANQWRTAVAFLPMLLAQPLLSFLSNVSGPSALGTFRTLLRANLLFTFVLCVLIASPVILCSGWIMRSYGTAFLAGKSVLILLTSATVLSCTASVIGQAVISLDKIWWAYILNFVWAVTLIVSAVLLVPRYGAMGLAGAFFMAYTANAITACAYGRRIFSMQLSGGKQ